MKNDFRERGILRVRVVTEEDHVHLYSLLEDLGYPKVLEWYGGKFYRNATNVYEINIFRKEARSVPSVTACAAMASSGVRFYSVGEFDRLAKQGFKIVPRFPVFHIPHDGWRFPEELMESVCIPKEQSLSHHEKMRDRDLNKIVPRPYRTGSNVARYDEVDRLCSGHPRVVLFDLHSYTDELVPTEFMKAGHRTPDICIGTDDRYTPPALTKAVRDCFEKAGFTNALNYPYSGCFVPDAVMRGESSYDCISIMIELNRRIYCDEKGESVPEKLERIQEVIQRIMDTVPWD